MRRRGFLDALSQLWTNSDIPEVRDTSRYGLQTLRGDRTDADSARVFIQDVPAVLDEFRTAKLGDGAVFGELAALGRIPRTATIFAETEAVLLEMRWQGLRELRKYNEGFRRRIDRQYRENALMVHLQETPLFAGLDDTVLEQVASATLFETYGAFDWHVSYQRMVERCLWCWRGRNGVPEKAVSIMSHRLRDKGSMPTASSWSAPDLQECLYRSERVIGQSLIWVPARTTDSECCTKRGRTGPRRRCSRRWRRSVTSTFCGCRRRFLRNMSFRRFPVSRRHS